ncbi:hypothetical protein ABHV46_13215 [Asaia sp. BMEF1]|uniref:hypothetical protein n=1 Tax=Asaia sp. BMEF1 TaxID=3155932 RepID=UPI003F669091
MADYMPDLLDAERAAQRLCISISSLRRIPQDELPSIVLLKTHRVWAVRDLAAYVERRAGCPLSSAAVDDRDRECQNLQSDI